MLYQKEKLSKIIELFKEEGIKEENLIVKRFIIYLHNYLVDNKLINKRFNFRNIIYNNDVSNNFSKELINIIKELSLGEIQEIIKELLLKVSFSYNWIYGGTTPQLGELAYRLLNLEESQGDIVYVPCSGVGYPILSLIEAAKRDKVHYKEILCNDISEEACYLESLLVDIFYQNVEPINIICEDMFNDSNTHYNKAILYGPLAVKMDDEKDNVKNCDFIEDILYENIINTEWTFIDKILSNISKTNFKAVVLVTGRTLWDSKSLDYRKKIIENGYLEGIIELPNKALTNTSLSMFLLILSKNNKEIKFLDATKMIIKNASRFSEREKICNLDLGLILENYYNNSNHISIDIAKNLKNLIPSTINIKNQEIENAISLNEVAEIFTGNQYTLKNFKGMIEKRETGVSILTSNDITDYIINFDSLTHIKYDNNKFDKYCIHEGDVVITSKSSKIKIGVVEFEPKEKIIVTGGIIIVRPKKEKLNSFYLKKFLDSQMGQNELKSFSKGTISTTISLNSKDLKELQIPLIDINKQNKIANSYCLKISEIITYKNLLKNLENSLIEFLNNDEEE